MTKNKLIKPDIDKLEKAFNGDLDLVLFFLSWVKNGRNSTEAYLELNPTVSRASAQVLGSRQLAKVDRQAVMKSYGLDAEKYFTQLHEGLGATRSDSIGQILPDYRVRAIYHDKLGKLLGLEDNSNQTNIQVNVPILGGASTIKNDVSINDSNQENTESN